jgi:ABC-2 type transport system ATP-binding protein
MLVIKSVTKRFGEKVAVDHLSLEVGNGGIFGLLGPNGAGKTTLIRMIMGIYVPDEGEILWQGQPITDAITSQFGYIPEERGLYPKLKVGEQLIYLLQLKGIKKKEAVQLAHDWLEQMELHGYWDAKTETLSKGMQQKLQFILALAPKPPLLILDEPFTGLDPVNTEMALQILRAYKEETKATILLSTHLMEQAEQLCDQVALINQGKVVLHGKVLELKLAHASPTYEIHVAQPLPQHLLSKHQHITAVSPHVYQIQLTDEADLLPLIQELSQTCELIGFSKSLPSLRSIFIETIKRRKNHEVA